MTDGDEPAKALETKKKRTGTALWLPRSPPPWTGTALWQLKSNTTGPAPWQVRLLLPGRWHHPVVVKPAGSASLRSWVAAPCGA